MFEYTFPTGRLVAGSLTRPNPSTNDDGTPKIDKATGQQQQTFGFAIAIAKEAGHTHWAQTAWGQRIWAEGHTGWPNGEAQRPDFAWKIVDGDSKVPGKSKMVKGQMIPGVAPCTKEGYPGHWVLWFSGQRAPQLLTMVEASGMELPQPRFVRAEEAESLMRKGNFFEIFGSCKANNPAPSPGVYINHTGACLRYFGTPINSGPDLSNAAFGQGQAPVGASTVAPAGFVPPQAPGVPPVLPPTYAAAPVASPVPALPIAPTPAVVPNPAFLQVPGAPAVPAAPPVAPVRMMTPKAAGQAYEAFVAAGWTDDMLRQQGYMA